MKNIIVVTGASSGIGKEFVCQLDKNNYEEIWAISLNKEKLEILKNETKTKIRIIAIDLTKIENINIYRNLLEKENPNIKMLINCSGFGKFGRYDEISPEESANMIDLNCKALQLMTEYSIPYMHMGAKIVQIASVAGFQPIPYISVYAATKAFVISYSRALNVELKNKGINVTCVCPFWTKTNFINIATKTNSKHEVVSKYTAMYTPQQIVKKALKDISKNKELSIFGLKTRAQTILVKLLPTKLTMRIWVKQQNLNKKYN